MSFFKHMKQYWHTGILYDEGIRAFITLLGRVRGQTVVAGKVQRNRIWAAAHQPRAAHSPPWSVGESHRAFVLFLLAPLLEPGQLQGKMQPSTASAYTCPVVPGKSGELTTYSLQCALLRPRPSGDGQSQCSVYKGWFWPVHKSHLPHCCVPLLPLQWESGCQHC